MCLTEIGALVNKSSGRGLNYRKYFAEHFVFKSDRITCCSPTLMWVPAVARDLLEIFVPGCTLFKPAECNSGGTRTNADFHKLHYI